MYNILRIEVFFLIAKKKPLNDLKQGDFQKHKMKIVFRDTISRRMKINFFRFVRFVVSLFERYSRNFLHSKSFSSL